ncbi:DUF4253 domain-containing protein [Streptomyces sp. BE147]|uniref:DUF4253 domain-containing protein n=1 Tax=unclassified Streptomyces TaxID=2593676 RepID=UPI002E75F2B5|nr:DUF4253 domain-containing protein [Streptomyces sp. BE147]MEE1736358.1 DUF4253 domain-containing protein [Streptomyces sp. BE147]
MASLPNPLPSLASSGLDLPPGSLVDDTMDGTWHEPLLWYANGPAAHGTWAAMRAAGKPLGLLPVLIDGGRREQWPEEWDLDPDGTSYPGDHDAEEVLNDYRSYCTEDTEDAEDGPEHLDLVPRPEVAGPDEPDALAKEIAAQIIDAGDDGPSGPRIALVPARRSADIPAAIGWTGPMNHENDVARLCAVLRSWEDRFDIRLVELGFDTLVVSVARPPTTPAEARALAEEHYAFCPDNLDQGQSNDLDVYAEKALLNKEAWSFWWD